MQREGQTGQRTEQSSHAIYGLIIITSALVADRQHAEDALTSLLLLWGAGLVLILAHVYSAVVAQVGAEGKWLSHAERHVLVVDNIPVLAAVIVPTFLITAAGWGLMDLRIAIDLSILLSVVALFVLGAYQARQSGATPQVQLGIGVLGGVVGIIVITLEILL